MTLVLLRDPASVSLILGFLGWVVAMLAAAVAFRRAGAGWPVTVLVGLASLFAIHPPPVGPAALVCFAAAALLIERWRARDANGLHGSRYEGAYGPQVGPEPGRWSTPHREGGSA